MPDAGRNVPIMKCEKRIVDQIVIVRQIILLLLKENFSVHLAEVSVMHYTANPTISNAGTTKKIIDSNHDILVKQRLSIQTVNFVIGDRGKERSRTQILSEMVVS